VVAEVDRVAREEGSGEAKSTLEDVILMVSMMVLMI
jgi:hypothetical protein